MEVVYYYHKNLGYSPVKKYLEQYITKTNDSKKKFNRKNKILSDIDTRIKHVQGDNGRPSPPISKPLRGYSYFEIVAKKTAKILIRIFYFCYDKKIVLLSAIEKPTNYDTSREKKKIALEMKKAEEYQNNFKLNPKSYEKYV